MSKRMILATVAVLCLTATLHSAAHPTTTEATWTDSESAAASITATDVPEPVATANCVLKPGVAGLDPIVTIYWRIPAGTPENLVSSIEYGQGSNGVLETVLGPLLGNLSTTGSTSAYTTVVKSGLLTGLLGGSKKIAIRLVGPGGWKSDWLVAEASMALAGLSPKCNTSYAATT